MIGFGPLTSVKMESLLLPAALTKQSKFGRPMMAFAKPLLMERIQGQLDK